MGKTGRWFRGLLGGKKNSKRWNFIRSFRDTPILSPQTYIDPTNKHAIAVAAATAAVAEAAVTAAHAAAVVVKLTGGSGRCITARLDWAAVRIQAAFRGYLAKKALWALKGLVKLQALVRGHIVRKKTADTMRAMQVLVRVQARARARASSGSIMETRRHINKHPGPPTPEKYERTRRSNSTSHNRFSNLKRSAVKQNSCDNFDFGKAHLGWHHLECRMEEYRETPIRSTPTDDEKREKILEIDPGKPLFNSTGRRGLHSSYNALSLDRNGQSLTTIDSPSRDSTTAQRSTSSVSSGEVQSAVKPRRFHHDIDDEMFSAIEDSPQFYSATSRPGSAKGGPFTPTKSEYSQSFYSGYSDHPNYMTNTESSRSKVRSQSAPRQRLEFEKSSSTKRYYSAQRLSTLRANFTNKAYPGSGRLDRLGMPDQNEMAGFDGLNRNRY